MTPTEKSSVLDKSVVKMMEEKKKELFFQCKGQTAIPIVLVFRASIAGPCSVMEGRGILGPAKGQTRVSQV